MCGRYYIDPDTEEEIWKIVRNIDRKKGLIRYGDVFPSQTAAVITGGPVQPEMLLMKWGFPQYDQKRLLINARAESITERKTFRECISQRRCIIPARGFYEWNGRKEKFRFEREDSPVLWMAGCYDVYQGRESFVVITTETNSSVSSVHDRMPLILEKDEIEEWLSKEKEVSGLLHKAPVLLTSSTDYEQMTLF